MLGRSPKNSEISPMTDAAKAADLLDEVIGSRGVREPVKTMLERAYTDLAKVNPKWTRRRVRAVFDGEARRIDNREIEEMELVIEARKQHAAYRQETAARIALAIGTQADRAC
jgi:hypothetical protein